MKVADDVDFDRLIDLCQNHTDWYQVYQKGMARVWTRKNDVSDFNMIKVAGPTKLFLICNYKVCK